MYDWAGCRCGVITAIPPSQPFHHRDYSSPPTPAPLISRHDDIIGVIIGHLLGNVAEMTLTSTPGVADIIPLQAWDGKFDIQIGSDWPEMGQIIYFLGDLGFFKINFSTFWHGAPYLSNLGPV